MDTPAVFECQLSKDIHEFAWLKGGRPVISDKRHKLSHSNGTYKLHITHLEPDDVAEYTFSCRGKKTSASLNARGQLCYKNEES